MRKVVVQTVTIAFVEMFIDQKMVFADAAITSAIVAIGQVVSVIYHAVRGQVVGMMLMMVCHRQWRW